jgi:hypothetical protein
MICMGEMGELAELARRLPVWLRDADELSDRYTGTSLRCLMGSALARLAADEPVKARRDVESALAMWSKHTRDALTVSAQISLARVELYEGDGAGAYARLSAAWRGAGQALLLRVGAMRLVLLSVRGAAALAASAGSGWIARASRLRSAERIAAVLAREPMLCAASLASLLRAGISASRGDRAAAIALLRRAIPALEVDAMKLHAAAARRRLGELLGGASGRALVQAADAIMSAEGIKRPDRFTAMVAPGFERG